MWQTYHLFVKTDMEKKILDIDEREIYQKAEANFVKICGFNLENSEKHRRMMRDAILVRDHGIEGIKPKSVVCFFDDVKLEGSTAIIEGDLILECKYFEQLKQEDVKGMYLYIFTAGECCFDSEEKIMDFLYADIWGTSYVDAGIDRLKEKYVEEDAYDRFRGEDVWVSDEFGPGYFGMGMKETKKIATWLNSEDIGISTKESGLIIPQKSCVGLYFVFNREILVERACIKCLGNKVSCAFCKKNGDER